MTVHVVTRRLIENEAWRGLALLVQAGVQALNHEST